MSMTVLLLAAALAGEPAARSEPAPAGVAKAAKPEKPKKVCVEQAQIGSLFPRRICATQEEWDRRAERDAAEMARRQNTVPSRN